MNPPVDPVPAAADTAAASSADLARLVQSFEPLVNAHWLVLVTVGVLLIWLVALLVFLGVMVKRYTLSDPASWPGGENPYHKETMAMPRGVFRAVLTVSLLVIVLFVEIISLTQGGLEGQVEQLMVAFQMMLAFYFGGKVMHHLAAVDRHKEDVKRQAETAVAEARSAKPPTPDADFDVQGAEG